MFPVKSDLIHTFNLVSTHYKNVAKAKYRMYLRLLKEGYFNMNVQATVVSADRT